MYSYNNNNMLSKTGAFILYKQFGGFTQYTFTHHTLLGAAKLTSREPMAAELGGLA